MSYDLSIVVVGYNMERELPRTLYSLSKKFQLNCDKIEYEVIYVDNGTEPKPNKPDDCDRFYYIKGNSSPAAAVNYGIEKANSEFVGIILDGARMASPGIISKVNHLLKKNSESIVATYSFHLGKQHQSISARGGYCQEVEDRMLESIDWKRNGYDLFKIASLAGSNSDGFKGSMSESCFIFGSKKAFERVGYYDLRYDYPGGGFLNLDIFHKLSHDNSNDIIFLLGEGTFHQFHGGISSSARSGNKQWLEWYKQYENIRGTRWLGPPVNGFRFFGEISGPARKFS